jgi:hypothetical protein
MFDVVTFDPAAGAIGCVNGLQAARYRQTGYTHMTGVQTKREAAADWTAFILTCPQCRLKYDAFGNVNTNTPAYSYADAIVRDGYCIHM